MSEVFFKLGQRFGMLNVFNQNNFALFGIYSKLTSLTCRSWRKLNFDDVNPTPTKPVGGCINSVLSLRSSVKLNITCSCLPHIF